MKVTHIQNSVKSALSPACSSIIKALVYYDIFKYPLTLPEIYQYSGYKFHHFSEAEEAIAQLKEQLIVHQFGEFYSLRNDYSLITRRQSGNLQAFNVMDRAFKRSQFIQGFPFVRSVNISGSLSKNYFDATTDVDYFIITKPGRLWLCRMMLTIFKKIVLFNSRKYFCINYYIDAHHLVIPDKNIFSATEIVTLKSQTGANYYSKFIEQNSWVQAYFPNWSNQQTEKGNEGNSFFKKTIERILSGSLGNRLESLSFKITSYFIAKKYKYLKKAELDVNLRANTNSSKHHPQGFQFKVLHAFEESCNAIEIKHNVTL